MNRLFLSIILFAVFHPRIMAQQFDSGIPGKRISKCSFSGFHQATNNTIVINTQSEDRLIHRFFDTTYRLLHTYEVQTNNRQLSSNKSKPYLVQNLGIGNQYFEVYAGKDSIQVFELLPEAGIDTLRQVIKFSIDPTDEKIIAVMPTKEGCQFLSYAQKLRKMIVYNWKPGQRGYALKQVDLPVSSLSPAELKEYGASFQQKYKQIFRNLTVQQSGKANPYQFPSRGQLFYNDQHIYILSYTPLETGVNVLNIDLESGTAVSDNYFCNPVDLESMTKFLMYPVATIYENTLVIQNSSVKKFQYLFYNLLTREKIRTLETGTDETLYKLVHSELRQLGTLGSRKEEKTHENEIRFISLKNSGYPFLTCFHSGDSLLFTFGSFLGTTGVVGVVADLFVSAFPIVPQLLMTGINDQVLRYSGIYRYKFTFAHSKFSLATLEPTSNLHVKTFLDELINDRRLKNLSEEGTILITLPGSLHICLYDEKTDKFSVNKYYQ